VDGRWWVSRWDSWWLGPVGQRCSAGGLGVPLTHILAMMCSNEGVSFLHSIPNGVLEEFQAEACLQFAFPCPWLTMSY